MMNVLSPDLSHWANLLLLVICPVAGYLIGRLYFRGLWWSIHRLVNGGGAAATIAVFVLRFALLACLLVLAALQGAAVLLCIAIGILIARFVSLRRARIDTP
ncbi:MAG: ATP synthase subunit I [Proteobacteria bacterium]|nr:ATP synthase subunit I [Pseudomonadota bacterium]